MAGHTDDDAADDVDGGNDQAGNGVTTNKLGSTVHRPLKLGLFSNEVSAIAGVVFVDQPGAQVGIDSHLFTGHGVESEPGRDFRNTARALRNHNELNDHQDRKDDHTDDHIATNDELSKRLDDLPRLAVQKDRPCRTDIQPQPEHGGKQQQRREARHLQRVIYLERGEQHQQRNGHTGRQQQIDDNARNGND